MGDWWTPLILRDLFLGVDTFDDLVEDLGLSRNLLSRRLTDLVERGLLTKVPYSDRPLRHRYALTDRAEELMPILAALTAWGDRWEPSEGGPPIMFRHRKHRCTPEVRCATCGDTITANNLVPVPGPGGRHAAGTMIVARRLTDRPSRGTHKPGPARS